VVLPMPSETSHWKGNEIQNVVALWETVLMSTKGGRDSKKQRDS
jgi:hypothetical protein